MMASAQQVPTTCWPWGVRVAHIPLCRHLSDPVTTEGELAQLFKCAKDLNRHVFKEDTHPRST